MTAPTPTETGSGPLVPSRAIQFSANIPGPETDNSPAVTLTEERDMPYDGIVSQVYVDIPDGVHSRAGFQIRDGEAGRKMFPFDEATDFAAFNDVQDFWPVSFPMWENDTIVVNYENRDSDVDSHLLKIWMIVVGEDALPYTLNELAQRDGVNL